MHATPPPRQDRRHPRPGERRARTSSDALFDAGADVFRLNFSHGTHEQHRERLRRSAQVEREVGRPIGVLADMQGPKLRVGTFANGRVMLERGRGVPPRPRPTSPATRRARSLPHPEIFAALAARREAAARRRQGPAARSKQCGADFAETRGRSSAARCPSARASTSPDVVLAAVGADAPRTGATSSSRLELGVEWLALSFVQRPEDLDEARALDRAAAPASWPSWKSRPRSRRSTRSSRKSDAVMVARGDLGVEMPAEAGAGDPAAHRARVPAARASR